VCRSKKRKARSAVSGEKNMKKFRAGKGGTVNNHAAKKKKKRGGGALSRKKNPETEEKKKTMTSYGEKKNSPISEERRVPVRRINSFILLPEGGGRKRNLW